MSIWEKFVAQTSVAQTSCRPNDRTPWKSRTDGHLNIDSTWS